MKKTIYMLLVLLSFGMAKAAPFPANTKINCFNQQSLVFTVNVFGKATPRVAPFDDATITFQQGKYNWHWLQLVSFVDGGIISQHNYAIYGGGKLTISETLKGGIGGCGRRLCDDDFGLKVLSAKLTAINGQQYVYTCTKNN